MPTFSYEGHDRGRAKVHGVVSADNKTHAIRLLEQKGFLPTRIDPVPPGQGGPTGHTELHDKTACPTVSINKGKLLQTARACQEHAADFIDEHRLLLRRALPALGMTAVLSQALAAFPIGTAKQMVLAGLLLIGLTAWNIRIGVLINLAALTLVMLFHGPVIGLLFGAAALTLLIILIAQPYRALVLLLTPFILQTGLGLAIPLGAGLFLDPVAAFFLVVGAAVVGLGYMAITGLQSLGPLVLNPDAACRLVGWEAADAGHPFLSLEWLKQISLPESWALATNYLSDGFHFALHPPLAFIQIAGWATAACVMARCSHRHTPLRCLGAAGGAGTVLLLQNSVMWHVPGGTGTDTWTLAGQLFSAGLAVSALGLATFRFKARERIQDTTFGSVSEGKGWASIGGLDDVKKEIQRAVQYHFDKRAAKLAKEYGLNTVKGILFYGPPGCGKTMFAKVIASHAGASFFSVTGADFRSKWFGEAEKNIAKVFAEARKHAPAVIFFDEIDQMLGKREETMTSDSPERRIVAQFLSEMDGIKELGNVLIVGATNEPDLIDPAALRPGRFDKLIYIPLPDKPAREAIFRVQLQGKPLADDMDIGRLAHLTERFSGADIADLCTKVAEQSLHLSLEGARAVTLTMRAFEEQLKSTKPSVSLKLLDKYDELKERYNRRTLSSQTGLHEEREHYTWDKIGGLQHVRQELEEAIALPLLKPDAYEKFKIRPPKGVLLFGPPGCGKTLMAKIVASECGAHFLSVDTKKESADSIKDWFIRARENKPCVLFFDEIDSLATNRNTRSDQGYGMLTQLLVEMDGMKDLKQVVVIAATNRPDALDDALMRPGRFDRLIYVSPPDVESRAQILRIHLVDKPLAADLDIRALAQQTEGYSGADLASVCYEASMNLIRFAESGTTQIGHEDFVQALQKIQPSIRPETRAYFDELKAKFQRG